MVALPSGHGTALLTYLVKLCYSNRALGGSIRHSVVRALTCQHMSAYVKSADEYHRLATHIIMLTIINAFCLQIEIIT